MAIVRLTAPVPLRTSADLGEFTEVTSLPRALGPVTLSPVRHDPSGHLWLLSDGVIGGVDRVEYEGREISTWALQQASDHSGHAVAVLETQEQIEDPSTLRVSLRGELHPHTGQALDRPDLQIWYLLSQIGGYPIAQAELDDLRAWCQSTGLRTGGLIDDHTLSIQTWLDRLTQACGLAWSRDLPGWAAPWPPLAAEPVAEITTQHAPRMSAECSAADLATVLEIAYDYDWSVRDYRATLRLSAPSAVERYGEIVKRLQLGWIHDARAALAHGERWLAYYARPLWRISAAAPVGWAVIGDKVAIDHAFSPIAAGYATGRDWLATGLKLALEAPYGAAPAVILQRTSQGVQAEAAAPLIYEYQDTIATWLITDDGGEPLPGARVTLDNTLTRTASSTGHVQFTDVSPGRHVLRIEAIGHQARSMEVVVS